MDNGRNPQVNTAGQGKIEKNVPGVNNTKLLIAARNELREVFSRVQSNFNVVHIQCQVVDDYKGLLSTFNSNTIDAILISKTCLKPTTSSNEIDLPGYMLIRNDREKDCGGVAIYLRECFSYKLINQSSNKYAMSAEHLFIEISHEGTKLLLGVFYNPSPIINYFPHFERLLQQHRLQYDHFICLGDFKTDLLKNNKRKRKLISIIDGHGIFFLPVAPTHVAPYSEPTITDLMLVSSPDNVIKSGHLGGYYPYHDLLYLSYKM